MGGHAGVWMRARSDLRARWRSLAGLALVIGLAGGAVLASVAAARRTDTAYNRFARAAHAADERASTARPTPDTGQIDFDRVVRLPQVLEAGRIATSPPPSRTPTSWPARREHARPAPRPDRQSAERQGRPSGPRVDEAMVDFALAQRDHLHPGSLLPIEFLGPDQQSVVARVRARIVGVVAVPSQFPPTNYAGALADPWVYLTPAFYRTYGDRPAAFELVAVRTKPRQQRLRGRHPARLARQGSPQRDRR